MYLKLIFLMLLFRNAYLLPEHDLEIEGKINLGDTLLRQIADNLKKNELKKNKLLEKITKDENNERRQEDNIDEDDNFNPIFLTAGLIKKRDSVKKMIQGSHEKSIPDTRRNYRKQQKNKESTESEGEGNHDEKKENVQEIQENKNDGMSKEAQSNDDLKKNIDELTQKNNNDEISSDIEFKRKKDSDNPRQKTRSKKRSVNKSNSKKKTVTLIDEFETYLNKSSDGSKSEEEAGSPYPSYPKLRGQKKIGQDTKTAQFIEHIIENGKKKIKEISEQVALKLQVDTNISAPIVSTAYASYTSKMKNYISYVVAQEIKSVIDREYLLLDIVASCNLLLYSEQRQILGLFAENKGKNVTQYEVDLQTEEVFKQYLTHKKQELFYVCEKLNVCRAYPGFSDYFAEFISDLLKLPDDGLVVVVRNLAKLIRNRTRFFKSFIKERIADAMGKRLQSVASDLNDFKETISSVRSIITQRFKLMKTSDSLLMTRTKAVRILIDIIDKTFGLAADDEMTVMTFDTAVQALRHWKAGEDLDIVLPLKLLMEHIVGVVKHNWDDDILEEISVLTEIIMVGKTKDIEVYKDLFSRGSIVANKYSLNMVDLETQLV